MNNEIKEILEEVNKIIDNTAYNQDFTYFQVSHISELLDYITNLQEENERLKQVMLVKQYYSETLPEGTEFVVLTKENYDRQQKDIQLELIDYKSRCEKAIGFIKEKQKVFEWYDTDLYWLLNILQGSEVNE